MGLDVRWLPPGRCVGCVGLPRGAGEPRRLGSLRSLNTWAVGLGFMLLEQFLAGSLGESLWLQGDVSADGLPRLGRMSVIRGRVCRSEEHTSELQSPDHLVCRLLLEKKKISMLNVIAYASWGLMSRLYSTSRGSVHGATLVALASIDCFKSRHAEYDQLTQHAHMSLF